MRQREGMNFVRLMVAAGLVAAAWAEEAPVPARFPVVQDRLGFGWQVTSAGSLFQSGTNVFESAGRLTVNGERFVAERVERDGERLVFEGGLGDGWRVRRETWIDREKALACFVETVRHDGDGPRAVVVEVAATVLVPWRSWWGRDRAAGIEGAPPPTSGAFLMFPPREGTTDLFFVFGDGKGPVQPRILASDKTFAARFEAEVAPGATLRLWHGMGQRRAEPGEIRVGTLPRWTEGRPQEVDGRVDNFVAVSDGLKGGGVVPTQLPAAIDGTVELWTSQGQMQLPWNEVVSLEDGWWTLKDGSRFRGVVLAGQTLEAVDLRTVRSIRQGRHGEVSEPARGLWLRNGEVWAGGPVGANLVLRGNGGPVEIPWAEVEWLRRGGNGELRVGRRSGESWTGAVEGAWLEWERNGTTWKLPWDWVDRY